MTEQTVAVNASFDVTTLDGEMKVFNAQNGASTSMKTLENGTVIECDGILQYKDNVSTYNKNGQESVITTLFGVDGQSYAGVSDTVAKAGEGLINFLKRHPEMETFKIRVTKAQSQAGNEFLNLQLMK